MRLFIVLIFFVVNANARLLTVNQAIQSRLIDQLKEGDQIKTYDNQIFTIRSKKGQGSTTVIYEIQETDHWVLRLPLKLSRKNMIQNYYQGWKTLKEFQVPVVEMVSPPNYKEADYLLVQKLPNKVFSILEFYFQKDLGGWDLIRKRLELNEHTDDINEMSANNNSWLQQINKTSANRIPKQQIAEMRLALIEFVKKLAPFEDISDFGSDQFVYDPVQKKWIIFDFAKNHSLFDYKNDKDPIAILDHLFSVFYGSDIYNEDKFDKLFTDLFQVLAQSRDQYFNSPINQCRSIYRFDTNVKY